MASNPARQKQIEQLRADLEALQNSNAELAETFNSLPGRSVETAEKVDLYGDDLLRAAASFGNPEGLRAHLEARGFTDPQEDAEGRIVARDKTTGKFVRDADDFFADPNPALPFPVPVPENPGNALLSLVGPSLPELGMVIGGAMGAAGGKTPGTTVLGAGAGRGLGELLRTGAGAYMGVFDPGTKARVEGTDIEVPFPGSELADTTLNRAAEGMAFEAGGQLIGKIPIPGTRAPVRTTETDRAYEVGRELRNLEESGGRLDEFLTNMGVRPEPTSKEQLGGPMQVSMGSVRRKAKAATTPLEKAAALEPLKGLFERPPATVDDLLQGAVSEVGRVGREVMSEATRLATGVEAASANRMLTRPYEVSAAGEKGFAQDIAEVSGDKLSFALADRNSRIADARKAFRDRHAPDMTGIGKGDADSQFAAVQEGMMNTDVELNVLRDFMTRREKSGDWDGKDRGVVTKVMRGLQFSYDDIQPLGLDTAVQDRLRPGYLKSIHPVDPGAPRADSDEGLFQTTRRYVGGELRPKSKPEGGGVTAADEIFYVGKDEFPTPRRYVDGEFQPRSERDIQRMQESNFFDTDPLEPDEVVRFDFREIEGQPYYLSEQHPNRILDLIDYIDSQLPRPDRIKQDTQGALVGSKTESILRKIRRSLKHKLHALDPQYAREDNAYRDFLGKAGTLRTLQSKTQRENFVRNLMKDGKFEQQRSFAELLPDEFDKVVDYYAAADFGAGGSRPDRRAVNAGNWMLLRAGGIVGSGVAGALASGGTGEVGMGTLMGGVLGMGLAGAVSDPRTARAGLQAVGKTMNSIPVQAIREFLTSPSAVKRATEAGLFESEGPIPIQTSPFQVNKPRSNRGTIPVRTGPRR